MSTSENIRRNQTGEQFYPMPTETKASIKTTELFVYLARSWPLSPLRCLSGTKVPRQLIRSTWPKRWIHHLPDHRLHDQPGAGQGWELQPQPRKGVTITMNLRNAAQQPKGKVKEAAGKATDNERLEAEPQAGWRERQGHLQARTTRHVADGPHW